MEMTQPDLLRALTRQQLQLTEQIHALTSAISLLVQTNQMLLDAVVQPEMDKEGQFGQVYMDGSRQ